MSRKSTPRAGPTPPLREHTLPPARVISAARAYSAVARTPSATAAGHLSCVSKLRRAGHLTCASILCRAGNLSCASMAPRRMVNTRVSNQPPPPSLPRTAEELNSLLEERISEVITLYEVTHTEPSGGSGGTGQNGHGDSSRGNPNQGNIELICYNFMKLLNGLCLIVSLIAHVRIG
ncbi:hypothetical protein Hanom_Chr01g00057911 [Helianthus anomalus]